MFRRRFTCFGRTIAATQRPLGETASNGDIVVALLLDSMAPEGVATLKRLYRERDRVRLQPANASMEPIYVMPESLRVQGKVVAVVRQLG